MCIFLFPRRRYAGLKYHTLFEILLIYVTMLQHLYLTLILPKGHNFGLKRCTIVIFIYDFLSNICLKVLIFWDTVGNLGLQLWNCGHIQTYFSILSYKSRGDPIMGLKWPQISHLYWTCEAMYTFRDSVLKLLAKNHFQVFWLKVL